MRFFSGLQDDIVILDFREESHFFANNFSADVFAIVF